MRRLAAEKTTPVEQILAWGVHLYTALGAPIALAAIVATVEGNIRMAFLWMAAALIVDATDGVLARTARVKEVLPGFDGARLDDLVDFVNYAVVPIFFAHHTGMLPSGPGLAVATAVLLASAYGFCQADAKTGDHFFTGFPSYWNVVVFYLYALDRSPEFNAVFLLVCVVLVFVPFRYLYPSRTPRLRGLTNGLGAVWGVVLVISVLQLPDHSRTVLWASLVYPAYYFALSFWLHVQDASSDRS